MLFLPQVRQPRSPRPLLAPLHYLYAFYIRAIDLKPHLHAHPRQFVPQKDAGVDPAPSDVDAYACDRVAVAEAHQQDVAHARGFGVGFGEESCAEAGGVVEGDLGGLDGGYGVFEK